MFVQVCVGDRLAFGLGVGGGNVATDALGLEIRWAMGTLNGSSERQLRQAFADNGLPPPALAIVSPFLPARYHLVGTSDLLGFGTRQQMWYAAAAARTAPDA